MTAGMTITLLHTAEAHRVRFDNIRDRINPDMTLKHVVRPRWLKRRRTTALRRWKTKSQA